MDPTKANRVGHINSYLWSTQVYTSEPGDLPPHPPHPNTPTRTELGLGDAGEVVEVHVGLRLGPVQRVEHVLQRLPLLVGSFGLVWFGLVKLIKGGIPIRTNDTIRPTLGVTPGCQKRMRRT